MMWGAQLSTFQIRELRQRWVKLPQIVYSQLSGGAGMLLKSHAGLPWQASG